jgi:tRNA(Glu) U13 pseudouridine synthase TruD
MVAGDGEPANAEVDPTAKPDGRDTMSLGEVCEALEYAGVDRGQRPLSVVPWDVHCESADETVTLSFSLPVGAYATVMLSNHFDLQDKSVEHRV